MIPGLIPTYLQLLANSSLATKVHYRKQQQQTFENGGVILFCFFELDYLNKKKTPPIKNTLYSFFFPLQGKIQVINVLKIGL